MKQEKVSKSPFNRILDVILGIIAVLAVLFCACSFLTKASGKSVAGYTMYYVPTNSMEPTIPTASYILVKDTDGNECKDGDVVTFVSLDPSVPEGATVTHRIVGVIDENSFLTKGDNNPINDVYPCLKDNIKAKFVKNLPVMTFIGKVYSSPAGYASTLGLLIIVFSISAALEKKPHKLSKKEMDKLVAEEVKKLEEESKKL